LPGVAEDVDQLYRNRVAPGLLIGVLGGGKLKLPILAGAETLPLILDRPVAYRGRGTTDERLKEVREPKCKKQ